jgi:hypothetical protein
MKRLEDRILELIKEDYDQPSFGNDDSTGDDSGNDTSSNSSGDSGGDSGSDDSSSEDGPSFGNDDSSDNSSDSTSGDSSDDSSDGSSNANSDDENSDGNDDSKEDSKNDDDEEQEEEFKAESFDDFLKQTESRIKITRVSSEPSPIFGSNDTKNHNKYKITISNEKGNVWFYFWDSLHNTENSKQPSRDDVLACFGMDVGSVMDGVSKDEFKEMSGYDKSEDSLAQKAYDGCQKMLSRAKKLFEERQIKELLRLSQEH